MACPHLAYRTDDGDHSFAVERAYCERAGRFVQPLRADICNGRYGLDHATHCEIFRGEE